MCQNYLDEIATLKREVEQSQIAYNILLGSQTGYIERLRKEIRRLQTALAATSQNQKTALTDLTDIE